MILVICMVLTDFGVALVRIAILTACLFADGVLLFIVWFGVEFCGVVFGNCVCGFLAGGFGWCFWCRVRVGIVRVDLVTLGVCYVVLSDVGVGFGVSGVFCVFCFNIW